MGRMGEIARMHKEGYSIEYIAWQMKSNTVTIKNIIYGDANENWRGFFRVGHS